MKNLLIAVYVCAVFFACNKTNSSSQLSVTGKWELRESDGGFAGVEKYQPGNGNIIQFNNDFTITFFNLPSTATGSGSYSIIKNPGNIIVRIKYDSASYYLPWGDSATVKNDTLTFFTPPKCCDFPYITIYRKIN
jgi:hypothetical protein